MIQIYDWERYWVNQDEQYPIIRADRLENFTFRLDSLLKFSDFSDKSCLLLLGEPGSGKSHAVLKAYQAQVGKITNEDQFLFANLKHVSNKEELDLELFNEEFECWLKGKHTLHVFIDSLDESLMQFENLISYIERKLTSITSNLHRLKMRIACRSGVNVMDLIQTLQTLWDNSFGVYHLTPLEKDHIVHALQRNNINKVDWFIQEAERKSIVSFLVKPITLQIILNEFIKHGRLPITQREIYERGCAIFCSEVDSIRNRKRSQQSIYSDRQKLETAKCLAALCIMCNKSMISSGPSLGNFHSAALSWHDINIAFPDIGENLLFETLQTGLFYSLNAERFGWSHLTYAEYLCSVYMQERMSDKQIQAVIIHPEFDGRVVPQLHVTAAWIASAKPDFFQLLLENEVDILFLCDLINFNDQQKYDLVDNSLTALSDSKLFRYLDYRNYRYLSHPGLVDQLRNVLKKADFEERSMEIALEIARQCQLYELLDECISIIYRTVGEMQGFAFQVFQDLAKSEDWVILKPLLRYNRPYKISNQITLIETLYHIGKLSRMQFFLSLAFLPDRDDAVKEAIRKNIQTLSFRQLNDLANQIVNFFFAGSRQAENENMSFLAYMIAIEYFEKSAEKEGLKYVNTILSVRSIHLASVLAYKDTLSFRLFKDDLIRRAYISAIIDTPMFDLSVLREASKVISLEIDFPWLVSNLNECVIPKFKARWNFLRKETEKRVKSTKRFGFLTLNQKDVQSVVLLLNEIELPSLSFSKSWEKFSENLEEAATQLIYLERDYKKIINILSNDSINKSKLIHAAYAYLLAHQDEKLVVDRGLSNDVELGARTAFKILYLLENRQLDYLPTPVLMYWMPLILKEHWEIVDEDRYLEFRKHIVKKYPELAMSCLLQIIDHEEHLRHSVANYAYYFWSDSLGAELLKKAMHYLTFNSSKYDTIIRTLIVNKYPNALTEMYSLLSSSLRFNEIRHEIKVLTACRLMSDADWNVWSSVWPCFDDKKLGTDILLSFLSINRNELYIGHFFKQLEPYQLTELFSWIELEFVIPVGDYSYNWYDVKDWKTLILDELRRIGTKEALSEVKKLAEHFPGSEKCQNYWNNVLYDYMRMDWKSLNPHEVKLLSNTSFSRIVRSNKELMEVVIESLDRLQLTLQGTTPLVRYLWQERSSGNFEPVDENDFSNFVKIHLENDLLRRGIIINREVEIRRGYGGGVGERTDLLIESISQTKIEGYYDNLMVIVEVKRCIHKEVDFDMENQLVNRYMKDTRCDAGIYLVAWFYCDHWKTIDENITDASKRFKQQANELSHKNNLHIRSVVMNTALRQ